MEQSSNNMSFNDHSAEEIKNNDILCDQKQIEYTEIYAWGG